MCERRMQSAPAEFPTAEENYNYGMARLNTRELAVARRYFDAALSLRPTATTSTTALAFAAVWVAICRAAMRT